MYIDRRRLKEEAKSILQGASVSPIAITALYLAICLGLDTLDSVVSGGAMAVLSGAGMLPTFITIFVYLVELVLGMGLTVYCLGVRHSVHMELSTLFDGFSFVGKIILLFLAEGVFISLWSMLFFFPGIVAMYRYRFAFYNLCEDPSLSAFDALNMSKRQTSGYKLSLLTLDLSFIGWGFLMTLPYTVVNSMILNDVAMPLSLPVLTVICGVLSGLVALWVRPYLITTNLGYYELAKASSGVGRGYGSSDPLSGDSGEPWDNDTL
ncbi:DUF975 family protein [Oscillibacter sp. MSJ-2]|uniref:DUF975 family protein n=1 Tax=Dysosmobacter acutus TaxID=2841504 RepID=A0ABS6F8E2_9FIRM|nr:DUF975 family protein [Dysosmobacter acutus]MBU5625569.1 DUF975 family protein [Dysosmobacter acutus]